jgi:hypothetical protein
MKEVERHLGVSYPTARARFDALLGRLGLAPVPEPAPDTSRADRVAVLEKLARGEVDIDAASDLIS